MKDWLYYLCLFFSRIRAWVSSHTSLYTARHAFLHEIAKLTISKADIGTKMPAIFLALGKCDRVLAAKPRAAQQEIGNGVSA